MHHDNYRPFHSCFVQEIPHAQYESAVAGGILCFSFAMLEVNDSLILAAEERYYPITNMSHPEFLESRCYLCFECRLTPQGYKIQDASKGPFERGSRARRRVRPRAKWILNSEFCILYLHRGEISGSPAFLWIEVKYRMTHVCCRSPICIWPLHSMFKFSWSGSVPSCCFFS